MAPQPRIETIPLGPLDTNAYLIISPPDCWVVDPGLWPEVLIDRVNELKLIPSRILLTHGHVDHIAGVEDIKRLWNDVRIYCGAQDADMLADPHKNMSASFGFNITSPPADVLLQGGEVLKFANWTWRVLDTSGHTPGGISYYSAEGKVVLTGDALFAQSIGRTDIPGGDGRRLLANIRKNLMTLPNDTRILSGHGGESTIRAERIKNPFLIEPPRGS